jgi:hypothetical protein
MSKCVLVFLNLKKVFNDLVCFLANPGLVCTCIFFLEVLLMRLFRSCKASCEATHYYEQMHFGFFESQESV